MGGAAAENFRSARHSVCRVASRRGNLDLRVSPPPGVFYNRMSASSHTRDHRYAPELTGAVLSWLKSRGATVVNGERALQLELSKVAQYEALAKFGIETPQTLAVVGRENIAEAARRLGYPVILKHNRAGKGLGVRPAPFCGRASASTSPVMISNPPWTASHWCSATSRRLNHSSRVWSSSAANSSMRCASTPRGFELCPADVCQVDAPPLAAACPTISPADKFRIERDFRDVGGVGGGGVGGAKTGRGGEGGVSSPASCDTG